MRTDLAEMGHSQPLTPVAMDNKAENSILNRMTKQKKFRSIYMRFYCVRNIIGQNNFHIFWEEGKKTWCIMTQNPTQYGTTEL